ncbi:ABC transporter permease [Vagococcus intermedius]|uniref:ABC transporter permease n=1 Tax=Vagococcus intermedius TaxID=2991418 RepID=A0AAF0I6B8_9ENTE|nr:ABC transporter permease [Vagococcus intermedius]WEG72674.1 ABC transporter permease [Vagococcus intermedius]WEG74759.1 ABC transporter permease [Vagococcus intermedius]
MLISTIGQGLIWGILGLGIFMTYRLLNFPDMTVEGSYPLGGAVCVMGITQGMSPVVATLLGVGIGMLAGLTTGLLYTKGNIPIILAGILVMSASNSVILFVMKSPSLSLLKQKKIHDLFQNLNLPDYFDTVLIGVISVSLIIILLLFFLKTQLGQAYIATGDNEQMARSFGINTDKMKIIGLTLSNGMVALSGALLAQNDGYASVDKGIGIIVIGLASIIIGEVIFGELQLSERLLAIVVGSILYQLLILLVIKLGFNTNYLKLISAVVLASCLMLPTLKINLNHKVMKRSEER